MSRKEPLPRLRERVSERRERALRIAEILGDLYPDTTSALNYGNPWQLLVATVLSAQCTDARVNLATPGLFAAYPGPDELAEAPQEHVEELVRSTGFYRQKAKNIIGAARLVRDRFDGQLPDTVDDLVQLPGAARKTANVVVSNCFPDNVAGIAVDTHVQRVSRRLGLTRSYAPEEIEQDLMRLLPRELWGRITHLLIDHGRETCTARNPACERCPLAELCPSAFVVKGLPPPAGARRS